MSVLLGNGDGTFAARTDFDTGVSPMAIVSGDLNGDGIPDLATANQDSSLSVLLGIGDGTFVRVSDYKMGTMPNSLAIGDVNGDGRSDLATAAPPGSGSHMLPEQTGSNSSPWGSICIAAPRAWPSSWRR